MDWPWTLFAVWSLAASWLMKDYCWVLGVNPLKAQSIQRVKTSCSARNPKCANTTRSKFNQLSLVAEVQLPFDCTNKRNHSPCFFGSPQTSVRAFAPRWWYSIYYDGHSHLSRGSVPHKLNWAAVIRDLRGCHQERERKLEKEGYLKFPEHSLQQTAWPTSHTHPSCRMKWMTCLALNVSLMGQQVPIWVSCAGRLERRRERERGKKKHLIRRLGIGSGKELHAILDQSCSVYFLKEGPLIINSDLFLWAYTV